jgi:hypothetical protein
MAGLRPILIHDEEGMFDTGAVAQHSPVQQAGDAGVTEAREQLRLADEARIPWVERELEGSGARVLRVHGAVDGAISALALPGLHAPSSYLGSWGETEQERLGCVP